MALAVKKIAVDKTIDNKLTAAQFVEQLISFRTASGNQNSRYFSGDDEQTKFIDVRMSQIFKLSKEFMHLPLKEIQQLLKSDYYEARMGAVSIMDFQARDKKIFFETKKELYDLYIKRHDRINNWDLVDRAAPYVVGGYLFDKKRAPLYKLARSKNIWERRTAIVSTYFFIRKNDLEDTFKIAGILVHDKKDLINKVVGSWIREAGKRDPQKLINFLDKYAATMPRVTLRYAIGKLDPRLKKLYMTATK